MTSRCLYREQLLSASRRGSLESGNLVVVDNGFKCSWLLAEDRSDNVGRTLNADLSATIIATEASTHTCSARSRR